jgi:GH25 family lysozyme M1 (1,4-beta-N-acetylmuramidase)
MASGRVRSNDSIASRVSAGLRARGIGQTEARRLLRWVRVIRRVVPFLMIAAACFDAPTRDDGTKRVEVVVCAPGAVVEGIDVSVYQGVIDWPAVKAGGVQFAIIRVSDGVDHADAKFATNWAGARGAGVLRGVYQYFQPAQDPIAQADLMLAAMGPLAPGDLPPAIDVETTGGRTPAQIAAAVKQWIEHVAAATGRTPIIYTGKYFWQTQVGGADLTASSLWEAQWGVTCPDTPSPWLDWRLWQHSATGKVAGISGDVDLDRFNGDLDALRRFADASSACGDGTCTAGEDSDTCAADCPPCGVIAAAGGVIDDGDACFRGGGDPKYLRAVDGSGWDGDLMWTHTTSDASEVSSATWDLHLAEAGRYRVEVYTPAAFAQATRARYVVDHAGAIDEVAIDQTAADGWQSLGEHAFAAGGRQSIHLGDNTGEPLADNVQIVFDAIRLTRIDPPVDGGPGEGGDVGGGCAAAGSRDDGGSCVLVLVLAGLWVRRRRACYYARA